MDFGFYLPTKLICFEGCVRESKDLIAKIGKKPLIVTGERSARACGALDDVLSVTEGGVIFDGVRQNPASASCFEAAKIARENGCDFVIGIGGGSPLDAAKAAAVLAADPDLDEAGLYAGGWKRDPLPVVCVGTTAGTGSEVTAVAVITDSQGRKRSVKGDRIFPALSLGDWRYTRGLDAHFTASTAVDALAHCVESYLNRTANGFSESLAALGIKRLAGPLSRLARSGIPDGLDRRDLYEASLLGGMAISVTGTAMCHAMGYFLSEDHGISHGFACGLYLETFIELTEKAAPDAVRAMLADSGIAKEELFEILRALLKNENVTVSAEEAASLSERWTDNKSIKKSLFTLSPGEADGIVKKLFVR